ncbi:MAG: TetR/AcrR family transcriptional regulator [Acutalibacteraceae bacterium]
MKNKIIDESIKSLQQEGLRFSVDSLAERLKISKKTIYKYFPTKEALAYAIYEKYYNDLQVEIKDVLQVSDPSMTEELLTCYFNSSKMVRKEIFNKYCLNHSIGNFALQRHLDTWNVIKPYVCNKITDDEAEIYKLIINGAFDKAIEFNVDSVTVIKMLRRLI